MRELLSLPRDEAHLWIVHGDRISPHLIVQYRALMSADELSRYERYPLEEARHTHAVTRALVRTVLSRYADVEPEDWAFVANEYGRPQIGAPSGTELELNVSHTTGMVVCAVTRSYAVGCDVERVDRSAPVDAIARRFFSPLEADALAVLSPALRRSRFFDCWTLKEAYAKARGMGLALPLDASAFSVGSGDRVAVSFDPRMDDDPALWQLELIRPTPKHALAVAIRRGARPDLRLVVRETVPLCVSRHNIGVR